MIIKFGIQRNVGMSILLLFCILIIYGCSDDELKNDNYYDDLNGFWIGTETTRQVGSCSYSGISVVNALLKIEINKEGIVEIIEYDYVDSLDTYQYVDSAKYHWVGTIDKEYDFDLQKPGFSNCFGEPREYFTQYEGTVLNINGEYKLKTNSDEEWCPSRNCIFNIEYDLTYVDSLITNIKK